MSDDLPLFRFIVAVVLVTFVSSAFGFVVCLKTESFAAMCAAIAASGGLGMLFVVKWWIRTIRKAGVPVSFSMTRSRRVLVIVYAAFMVTATATTYFVYAVAHARLPEVAFGLCIGAIGAYYLIRKSGSLDSPQPFDARYLRISAYSSLACAAIFAFNLTLQIVDRNIGDGVTALHEAVIASYSILIPMQAAYGYRTLKSVSAVKPPTVI